MWRRSLNDKPMESSDEPPGLLDRLVLLALVGDALFIGSQMVAVMWSMLGRMWNWLLGLLGLSSVEWGHENVGVAADIAVAVMTGTLALIGWIQLGVIARQQSQSATLDACNRYDSELPLQSARRRLDRFFKGKKIMDDADLELTFNSVFNYFDAIAIGIAQKLYDEKIAQEHVGNVLRAWIRDVHESDHPTIVKLRQEFSRDYSNLQHLYRSWYPQDSCWLNRK